MTLIINRFLAFFIAASLAPFAFSQGTDSAQSLYRMGESLVASDPDKAFDFFEMAMNEAQQKSEWSIYLLSINRLASLDVDEQLRHSQSSGALSAELERQEEKVFALLKEAVEVLKNATEDTILAQLHYNTGEYYFKQTNQIDRPIFHYQKAKIIWTGLKGEWSEEVSNCYHGLGNIFKYFKFDFYEAEKCYEKALLIRERIGFNNQDVLYKNYYSLATTNRSQHDFEKALSYGTKALALAKDFSLKQLGPLRTEMSTGMLANIYRDMNQPLLAKKYYLTALELNKKTKDLAAKAWYYISLGETLMTDSSFSEAILYFERAYSIYKSPEIKQQSLRIRLLSKMVETYSLMGDEKKFLRIKRETLSLLDSLNMSKSLEASQIWLLVGRHQHRRQHYDSALFNFQKSLLAAVPSFSSTDFQDNPTEAMIGYRYQINETLISKALALKGKFLKTGDGSWLSQSLASLRLAEKLLSIQRNTLDMEDAKWKFLESKYDLYEDIISSLYQGIGKLPVDTINLFAFQYFEQSKSRSLADALAQTERTKQISGDDSLLRLHSDLKRQLFSAQEAVVTESDKPGERTAALREEVIKVDKSIQSVKFAIEEKYPGYFNVKYGYRSVPLTSVKKELADKDQVLLEYFWGNESVYAIGISDKTVAFKRIGSPDSINVVANRLLLHLTDTRLSMNKETFDTFTDNASELYRILVTPFEHLISGKKRIQIIPDGSINQVPFEALLKTRPQQTKVNYRSLDYMIRSFTVGYAYSSAMFLRKAGNKISNSPSLLAVGFTEGSKPGRRTVDTRQIIGAEEELKTLEKRFNSGKFLRGHDATETNFKAMAPNFDIIHLAIHGSGDIQKNFAASLYFGTQRDSLDDGELHAYELYGLKLKALMAVLSSCESGLGKGYKGEGMISMASAFTYSGCENILMSLWKVNDQAATGLMDNFYEYLLAGESIDEALRKAKINYLDQSDELTSDPKIWAPLIAYGNLDNVFQKRRMMLGFLGLAGLIIILLAFKIYKRSLRS